MVPVKTENFYLKEIESDDIENIFKGLSNHEITRYYDVHFSSLKETEEQMKWYRELKEEGTGIWWGIYQESDDEFCGAAGFNGRLAEHKKAEIGMWLLTEHWGKGILPEILTALFEYGFEKLDLNRIEGLVDHENSKCKRALEKIHFVHEGTLREYEIKDGRNVDLDVYAILKKDWKLIKNDKS